MEKLFSALAMAVLVSLPHATCRASEVDCLRVTNVNFTANFYPASESGRPGVLVLGGSSGGIPTELAQIARKSGCAVLALAYFGEHGLPHELEMIPLEYFQQPVEWLLNSGKTDPRSLVIVGWSKGAELALLLAARDRRIRGVVAISPSSVAWAGILRNWERTPSSSWSSGGKPVPFVPYTKTKESGSLLEMYNHSLDTAVDLDEAVIPVEKIEGPVLLISGGRDSLWPAERMANAICDRAKKKGCQFTFRHLCFPHGGHLPDEQQRVPYTGQNGDTNLVTPQGAILGFIREIAQLQPGTGSAGNNPAPDDPAAPVFHPKPADLRQPEPVKCPRTVLFHKPRALAKDAVVSDWPNFLGPTHDGISPETGIMDHFDAPDTGKPYLPPAWTVVKGESYSSPSIKDNLLILHHRIRNNEVIECLDAETGGLYWSHQYPTTYRDSFNYLNGPRASPAIDEDRIYTCGALGVLCCFDLRTGHLYWRRDLMKEFDLDQGFFGFTTSPIIERDLLILNVGGKNGACVVAFDKNKGTVKWLSGSDWGRSYATPVAATMHDKRILFVFAGGMSDPPVGGLIGLDPESGKVHFTFPWRSPRTFSVNASSPVVSGNRVFISSSYDIHGAMIEIQPDLTHKMIYRTRDFSSHWMTPIVRDGYLYGFANDKLVCLEWNTGKLMWGKRLKLGQEDVDKNDDTTRSGVKYGADQYRPAPDRQSFGFGSLTWADNRFLCLGETGLLAWLDLSPKGCRIISSCRLFTASQTWTAPVLSRGLLYVNQNLPSEEHPPRLLCYDLRALDTKP
jgi:outer membrane protein assembly factor BamB/dienelactone hydrolase